MELSLSPQLVKALADQAQRKGIEPDVLAEAVLRRELIPLPHPTPVDEWEKRLFAAALDCGVSVPDTALSSEGLYD